MTKKNSRMSEISLETIKIPGKIPGCRKKFLELEKCQKNLKNIQNAKQNSGN